MELLQQYKRNLNYNIYDDLEYLYDSTFFHKNKDNLFEVDHIDIDEDFLE